MSTEINTGSLTEIDGFYMDTVICDRVYDASEEFGDLDVNGSIEIGLVVSGVGVHRVLNQVIPCQEGDVFILNEHVPHRCYSSELGNPLTIRRIIFSPKEWLFSIYASSTEPAFLYGSFRENNVMAYAMLTQAVHETVGRLYDEIAIELFDRKAEWKEAIRARLVLLLISIARYTNRAIKNISKSTSDAWNPIPGVIAMVHEKYGNSELTLEYIASSFHLSRAHLGKIFKQSMGITFSEYLRRVRLEHACSSLIETNQTVEEIMVACGMRDLTSFYKAFGEYFGMTPNNYRKQHLEEKSTMSIPNEIAENLQKGKAKIVAELVQKALDEGVTPDVILKEGLLSGMNIIGEKFKNNEVYVPEVLVAARAMNKGTAILKPHLAAAGVQATGKVCIGTVQGDLHDIGKNLVKMMMEGKGLEVIDLGTDVSPETFVQTAIDQNCQIICCSALLTTTMGVMEDVVKKAVEMGIRDKVKIMIGGAPVNEDFCKKIGADCYTPDAASAADAAVAFCQADQESSLPRGSEVCTLAMGDKKIIRELAKQYMELATSEKQQKANRRMLDTNDLKVVRPPVLIDEIPWHELGCEELTLVCGDDFTRWIEWSLKSALYRKKYFGKADLLMPDTWTLHASFSSSPLGLESKHGMSERGSRIIYDVMEDEACLNEILPISFTTNSAADEATAARCEDLFGDIIPVRLVGVDCQYFPIWDDISFLRGVEPIYEDLYDRPEYLHRIMKIFCDRVAARLDFIEANMKVNPDPYYLHSTPGRVTPVAQEGLKATWFRGTAQCFSSVSPAMFKEFELDYIKPLAERFGHTYYGCCEPLDDRIELLRSIKNLRKIGVSPWANPEKCAEQIRGDYVMSRKPNPAHVAHETDPAVIRREAEESVKAALKYGCPMDYVLKDITTVSNKPQNLILWAETVSDVMDEYYGED